MEKSLINNHINDIIRQCKIRRFACELQNSMNDERKEMLKTILRIYDNSRTTDEEEIQKLQDKCDEYTNAVLKNKWTKLTREQKENRVNEYFSRKNYDKEMRKKIKNLMDEKKITSKNIEYDMEKCQIENIKIPVEKTKKK